MTGRPESLSLGLMSPLRRQPPHSSSRNPSPNALRPHAPSEEAIRVGGVDEGPVEIVVPREGPLHECAETRRLLPQPSNPQLLGGARARGRLGPRGRARPRPSGRGAPNDLVHLLRGTVSLPAGDPARRPEQAWAQASAYCRWILRRSEWYRHRSHIRCL
jgi:hypothetical protein